MNETTLLVNNVLYSLTLFSFIVSVSVFFLIVVSFINSAFKQRFLRNGVVSFFARNALVMMFLVTLFGFVGSVYYSDYAGFEACFLCIWQRFFFFPQLFIFGLALIKKRDLSVIPYSLLLSIIGGAIALFHYYGQMLNPASLPCEALATTSACAFIPFLGFGFITIPFMSLAAFLSLIVLGLLSVIYRQRI